MNWLINNKIRYTDATQYFDKEMEEETKKWYTDLGRDKGKQFMRFQKVFKTELWHKYVNLNGDEIKTFNKILAGHDLSEYWLHKMKIAENGT